MSVNDAVQYVLEIFNGDATPLQDILSKIPDAPVPVRKSLRRLRNLQQLENFLKGQKDHFIVENGKVVAYDPDLATGRERAVIYFEKELRRYDGLPNYLNFQGHVGQAEDDVILFINTFYPGEEFKKFLLAYPDIFFVLEDDTVCLLSYLNRESVDYFVECFESRESLLFMNLRGHLGQAPPYVTEFINVRYPKKNFLEFLKNNSDVFFVFKDRTVSLMIYLNCLSAEHFEDCLEDREGMDFMHLRSYTRLAPNRVIEFINTRYSGRSFLKFLAKNSDVFVVFEDATVFLIENQSVYFFKECLRPREGLDFMDLRGYLRYAPDHVIEFINAEYPGESFMDFLLINPHVFIIHEDIYVYLMLRDGDRLKTLMMALICENSSQRGNYHIPYPLTLQNAIDNS